MADAAGVAVPEVRSTTLDRLIARVSPAWGLKRLQSRARLEMASTFFGAGGYTGARNDRQQLKNWRPVLDGPNSATVPDLMPLRARAADLERNDPIAGGATSTLVTSTVGSGLRAHARVDREYLGLSDDAADALDRQIDRVYTAHAEGKCWDWEGRLDAYGQQELALRSSLGRGDVFVVRRFLERPDDLFATRFQLIEADRVSTPDGYVDTATLIEGIELDPATNRAVACWVQDSHPYEFRWMRARHWTRVEMFGAETGGWRVLQLYTMQRPGQIRGVPFLAPVIEVLKQLSRLSEAELMASVINALFTVFVKSGVEDESSVLPDMAAGAPGRAQNQPMPVADDRQLNLGAGMVVSLLPGEEIQVADPKRPNANYDPFFTGCVRQVGAALEIPFEVLIKHFTASYSASRAALLEFWRVVSKRRRWMVRDLAGPCREAIIEEAVLRGLVNAPGFFDDPLARRAYCRAEWTGDAMGQLNPLDEANAAEKRIDIGISTIAEETAQLTGGTWEAKHPQRVKEHRARAEAGLEPDVLGANTRAQIDPVADPAAPDPAAPAKPKQLPPGDGEDKEARHAA